MVFRGDHDNKTGCLFARARRRRLRYAIDREYYYYSCQKFQSNKTRSRDAFYTLDEYYGTRVPLGVRLYLFRCRENMFSRRVDYYYDY